MDFSRNNLSGKIPLFLGQLNLLGDLNLSFNKFEGEVPNEGVFKNIRVCVCAVIYRFRNSKQQPSSSSTEKNQYPQLSYAELHQSTNGFSSDNLIGKGRYGSVYKGILNSDEQTVAVKVLNLQESGAYKSFLAECEALGNLRHRNLVKVITSCSSVDFKGNDFKALVFEFMQNGSLESWLYPSSLEQNDTENLNLTQRLNMAIDVALALEYLHHHYDIPIAHFPSDFALQKRRSTPYDIAKDLWKALEDKFMAKSIENRLYLKKRLFRFDYKKGISMNEHLHNFNKILTNLKILDDHISDEDKVLLLLNSLPDSYDHLTTTLLYGKEKIKYVDVANALVNNEFRRKDKYANRDSASEALTVRGRTNSRRYIGRGKSHSKSRGKSSDRRRLAKDECAACRQKGH
ncbi:putative receptor-like protein kinase At3g47110 [Camellia sinensis]|uniref:putative receptor-like protein kinase At3g47110 n=1 Tax=Camellia sinensis TaxID=4442 RepID=UPI0010367113|nr:putative receptor-like protein kinase At3g47110 [Camellia sinensis]